MNASALSPTSCVLGSYFQTPCRKHFAPGALINPIYGPFPLELHFPRNDCGPVFISIGSRETKQRTDKLGTSEGTGNQGKISQSFVSWSFHLLRLLLFFSRPRQLLFWFSRDPLGSSANIHKFQNLDFNFYPPRSRDAFHHQLTTVPEKKLPSLLRDKVEKIRKVSEVWRRKDTNQRLCHSHMDRENTLFVFLKLIFCKKKG